MKKELAKAEIKSIFKEAETTVKASQREFKKYSADWTFFAWATHYAQEVKREDIGAYI